MCSKIIKVGIDARQWLRSKIQCPAFIMKQRLCSRFLRVGQGPHEFMNRLFSSSEKVDFRPWRFGADAFLFAMSPPEEAFVLARHRKIPIILRLDGIALDSESLDGPSRLAVKQHMTKTLDRVDGVIFQSEFSKYCFEDMYGKIGKVSAVIHNGFDVHSTEYYKGGKVSGNEYFVVGGRNAKRKRIIQVIDRFINSSFTQDFDLFVAGDFPSAIRISHPRIIYLGKITPLELFVKLKYSRGLIHMDWYDWCPNMVTEAISAGVPVLCGKVGGTPELVGTSGIIADLGDVFPNFNDSPLKVPEFSQMIFDNAFESFVTFTKEYSPLTRDDLQMSNVAKRYKDFILECMDKQIG